jgi:hypothetical protein
MKNSESPIMTLQAVMYLLETELSTTQTRPHKESPWSTLTDIRLNFVEPRTFNLTQDGKKIKVTLTPLSPGKYNCEVSTKS